MVTVTLVVHNLFIQRHFYSALQTAVDNVMGKTFIYENVQAKVIEDE